MTVPQPDPQQDVLDLAASMESMAADDFIRASASGHQTYALVGIGKALLAVSGRLAVIAERMPR